MTKHIATRCLAIALFSSVSLTPALPQPIVGVQGTIVNGHKITSEDLQNTIFSLRDSPELQKARANAMANLTNLSNMLISQMQPGQPAVPRSAPVTQNFIQATQPDEPPAGYTMPSYSESQIQPDLGDSEVSGDDGE